MLLTVCATLFLGCSGGDSVVDPQPLADPPEASPAFPILPPPSQIKFDSELISDRLTLGADFETGLPNEYVTAEHDSAVFDSHWHPDKKPAYAMYRLLAPENSDFLNIQSFWEGFYFDGIWMGIAEYGQNSWKWAEVNGRWLGTDRSYIGDTTFSDGDFYKEDHVLVVVVCLVDISLDSLIAGELVAPLVKDVTPKILMTGSNATFQTKLLRGEGTNFSWDFGSGALPRLSLDEEPNVIAQSPGNYSGHVEVENTTGKYHFEFSYEVTQFSPFEPLKLYAFPQKTSVQVGEELLVRVVTGQFPESEPFSSCSIGVLVDSDGEYVPNSFNMGSPGGEIDDCDGIWGAMDLIPYGFLMTPDSLITPQDTGISGVVRFDFVCAPLGWPETTSAGDLFNIKLTFSNPGEYHLGFQREYNIDRTHYNPSYESTRFLWYDISNSSAPAITVLP